MLLIIICTFATMSHKTKHCELMRLFFLLLWLVFALQTSEAKGWFFHTIDVKNGLADNYVRDISTDSEGYTWFSTINGLSRYDGYRFVNFLPQKSGAHSADVLMVRETADGTLWMVCPNDIFTFDRSEHKWKLDGKEKLKQSGIDGEAISSFYVDEDGDLWVATERGLYHHDYRKSKLSRIDCRGLGKILHIVAKSGTTLIVTTDYKIYKVCTDNNRLTFLTNHPQLEESGRDSHAMMDSKMNLWVYNGHSHVSSLLGYSIGSGQWHQPEFLHQLGTDITVNAMAEDRYGRLWVGTGNQGVYMLTGNGPELNIRAFRPTSSHITCLFVDRNNTIWAGSAKLGATFADLNCPEFTHVSTENYEDVSALIEDSDGNLWIGFDGAGIMMKNNNATTTYSALRGQLTSNNITSFTTDANSNILIGTYGGGILRQEGNRFVPLYSNYDILRYVKAIASDRHGALWVGTVDKGVVRIAADGKQFTNFRAPNSPLYSDGIMCLAYDAPGDRLYIGTTAGVAVYDCAHNSFINDVALDSLRDVNVTSILVDESGKVWIGSRNGLWVKRQNLVHITTDQGLTNNVIRALAMGNGSIWATTDNGLTNITFEDDGYKCRPYFDSDGLHDIIFSNNASLTKRDGTVLLGTLTGYLSISPDSDARGLQYPGTPPSLHVTFTEFRINGNTITLPPDGLTLEYGERLGVAVSMMVPVLSHKARYYYRFEGEHEWMRAPNNMLYFASLMPGTHVLQVKAELPGLATSDVSEFTFTVLTPVWLSKPAIAAYFLLFVVIAYLVLRAIRRRQKRELAMKQMEINLKKYEMEEQKISFFTNISHDIKTPLTMVMAPLEKIRNTDLPASVRTEIDVAWQNARQLYDLVLEFLDFRRLDEGKEKLKLSHGELVSFVRKTVHGFDYYAARKQIKMELDLPATNIEMLFDENKMRRIITNLLSNACKYNVDGGSIIITLKHVDANILLSVADTGIGIKNKRNVFKRFVQETHGQEQEGSGLGLHIVRQYVEMMGGIISVSDNLPSGTIFTIKLPFNEPVAENDKRQVESINADVVDDVQSDKPLTILVVEDNTDARQFLQRSLEDEYQVLLAANGKEALKQLGKNDNVSIIISDVMMPVMDGMELVRQIRNNIRFSHIPVILLTAKSSEEDIVAGLKEGVADYLTKPFSLNVLRLRIQKILEWTQQVHEQVATGIDIKPSEITVSSLDEELITHLISEVEANMSDSGYSVVQLSSAIGMTRGTLYKKLMAIVGKSPIEFIRIIRLKRAKSFLDQGRTNISEVADKVGFSPKVFAQYFRETYGETPSEYLKNKKSKNK